MTAHHIRYEVDGEGIATITIDRPEKRNAMTYAMLGAFIETVARAGADESAKVVIITGGGGTFCAGTDLADLATIPGETRGVRGTAEEGHKWWPIVMCPKPVIGAIDGFAVGMGAEFTSQCDVRIISNRARFAWNFAHRGLVPDTGAGSWLLPRIIGPHRALRLLYSGAFLEADEALAIGYAAEMVAPEDLQDAARAEARRYLSSSPFSLQRMKALVWQGLERDVAEHMAAHVEALSACFKSADHKEGVAAFLERRPAQFTGR
jgi:enoyl-CoA hydratase/carnithine racemase